MRKTGNKFEISIIKTCPSIRIPFSHMKRSKRHEVHTDSLRFISPHGSAWMDDRNCFGHWIFEHCNLFVIWCLSFVIF